MTRPRQGTRRALTRRILALVGVYVGALLCAGGLFLAYRVHSHHRSLATREFFWLGGIHQNDEDLGFRMAPSRNGVAIMQFGIEEPHRRIPVRTDQLGFRIPIDRDSTTVRAGGLAGIGCSCTFGHGVAAESTWVSLAGAMLGLPAYNMGVCSYSSVTSVELLRRHIGALRPAWAVYAFGNFHLERSREPRADATLYQAYLTAESNHPRVLHPLFSNRLCFELEPRIEEEYNKEKLLGNPIRFDGGKLRVALPLAFQDLARVLQPRHIRMRFSPPSTLSDTTLCSWMIGELRSMARPLGTRVALLFFPSFFTETPLPGLLHVVRALDNAEDFVFVDCSERLFAQARDEKDYQQRFQVPRDGHPNGAMHMEMATALTQALTARGFVPRPEAPP